MSEILKSLIRNNVFSSSFFFCKYNFLILGPFQCSFCKYPLQTSKGKTLYSTLYFHIYGGGNIYLARDMEKPGSSAHFSKRTGCTPWFFRMSAGTKLSCAFNNSSLNRTKKEKENGKFAFLRGYISRRRISMILIINAPKWRRNAGNGNYRVMQRF